MWDLHTTTDMRLLLLVCLLTWPGITSAEETGFVTVAEGDDAVLPCSLSSKENIQQMIFDWKKDGEDQKQVFYYVKGKYYSNGLTGQDQQFIGRVSYFQDELKFGNASIKIRNTELADNGSYTCIFPEKQKSHITLYVVPVLKVRPNIPGAARKPNAKPIHETERWSLLQCEVQGVPKPTVEWKDSTGEILPAKKPEVVERDHRFYVTLQIIVNTTNNFTCVATQEDIHHQINSTVAVHVPGATPKLTITYLNQRKDWSLLQCEVQGVPKSIVVWKDSTGNILPAKEPEVVQSEGHFYITLQIVVNKTDNFTCVATQEKSHHQINATASVYIHVAETPTGWIVGVAVLGAILFLLSVAGVVAVLRAKGHLSANFNTGAISNSESAQLRGSSPSGHLTDPSL